MEMSDSEVPPPPLSVHGAGTTNEVEGYRGLAQHGGPPGWLEESEPAGRDFVRDERFIPPALTDQTICPGLGLIYY
jgi:hypothetical protein